jgi:hypothetical protein
MMGGRFSAAFFVIEKNKTFMYHNAVFGSPPATPDQAQYCDGGRVASAKGGQAAVRKTISRE